MMSLQDRKGVEAWVPTSFCWRVNIYSKNPGEDVSNFGMFPSFLRTLFRCFQDHDSYSILGKRTTPNGKETRWQAPTWALPILVLAESSRYIFFWLVLREIPLIFRNLNHLLKKKIYIYIQACTLYSKKQIPQTLGVFYLFLLRPPT